MTLTNAISANSVTPLPIINGGTGVNAVTTAPTATAFAGWDAHSNLSANNAIEGYTTTVTAAGTTVLTVASTKQQFFTGSTTQTVTMPVTSTLVLGQSWLMVNNSSGTVTIQSSGGNTITAMAAGTEALITCILISGTTASSWNSNYSTNVVGVAAIAGTTDQIIASSPTGSVTLSLPQSIATSSALQFGSVNFTTTAGIIGTTTNDNANAGSVGELIFGTGGPVSLTSGVPANIVSVSLTPGDWDLHASIFFSPSGATTLVAASISPTSATLGSTLNTVQFAGTFGTSNIVLPIPYQRVSLAMTTTYYVVGNAAFASTLTANANFMGKTNSIKDYNMAKMTIVDVVNIIYPVTT